MRNFSDETSMGLIERGEEILKELNLVLRIKCDKNAPNLN